jgi:hypothetical protein
MVLLEGSVDVSVTVRPSAERVTPVLRRVRPANSVRVLEFTDDELRGLEKVRTTGVFCPTADAPWGGVTEVTTGGVVSVPPATVKVVVLWTTVFPAKSVKYVLYAA